MFTSVLPAIPTTSKSGSATAELLGPSKRVAGLSEDRDKDGSNNSNAADKPPAAAVAGPPPLRGAPLMRRKSSVRTAATAALMLQRSSRKSSVRKSMLLPSVLKPDVPPHLLKFLQMTPEQQQRLNAVKAILVGTPSARNEMSLDVVYDWMLHNCKQYSNNIFGSAPEYIRREICRQMRLIKVLSQGLLIRQGDSGDRCYIVVNGIVDVYIKKQTEPSEAERAAAADAAAAKSTGVCFSRSSNAGESAAIVTNVRDYGDMVANLGPGAMFGEVVLLNPTAKRNATIVASQYTECCELICLERADYIRLVRTASMEASHYNHAEILDQMYLFQGWDKHEKMRLVSAMRSLKFISNEYLYRAGSDAKWLYVITSGDVVERLNWAISSTTTASNSSASDASSSHARQLSSTAQHPHHHHHHASHTLEKKVNIELALIGAGDIAGELPFVSNKWVANFDIKAVTDVQTLAIDRRYFETHLLSATPTTNRAVHLTFQRIKQISREREDWRQQRLACGTAYPNAHITITWQLMRMSNLRCPRCGTRGHLATDTARCASAVLTHGGSSGSSSGGGPSTSTLAATNGAQRKSKAAVGIHRTQHVKLPATAPPTASRRDSPRRQHNSVICELMDDEYLPTAKEQLAYCRSQQLLASPSRVGLSGLGSRIRELDSPMD